VYGAKDLAVRTQGNIQMHSDRSISFNAGGNFNINAEASVKIQAQVIQARADTQLNLYGKQTQVRGQSATSFQSGGSMQIKSGGAMLLNGSKIALNGEGGGGSVSVPQKIREFTLPDAVINDNRWEAFPDRIQSICSVVPTHEPYIRGNIAAVAQTQVDIQSALTTDINGQPISPPVNIKDVGTKQAESFTIADPAPVGEFIAQPAPIAGIGSLSNTEVQGLFAQYGYNSSNNTYDTVNEQGLAGKYGLSNQDLISQGYLIEGTPQTREALENPNNWIGKDGINSLDNFTSSPAVQERTMYDTTRDTYAKLEGLGLITATTTSEEAAGLVGAAKYSSPEIVYQWVTKGSAVDPKVIDVFNSSKYSITQAPIIEQSNKSKLGL
jgi:hypothetical protein